MKKTFSTTTIACAFVLKTILCVIFLIVLSPPKVWAEELGEFQIRSYLLEPQYSVRESGVIDLETNQLQKSGFELRKALVGIGWKKDSTFSGYLGLGNLRLINRPSRVGSQLSGYGVYEAYAQASTDYGTVRAGLIPMLFGIEGRSQEFALEFPRSLLFQTRQMGLRDYGVSYFVNYGRFYTAVAAHNGEGGDDTDDRLYSTAVWGWHQSAGFHLGISAQAGRTVDPTTSVETKARFVNAFALLKLYGVGFSLEGTAGENKVGDNPHQLYAWHADLYHRVDDHFGALARYDEANTDTSTGSNKRQEVTVGLSLRDTNNTSILYLYGIKRLKESDQNTDDEIRLVWRITSSRPSPAETDERFE